jgi:DNA-binding transcriptional LysR family regulator
METRFLEDLLAVAELGSMAAAARRRGVTPAAVAQRIRALEQEIGTPLIARSGRNVMPTEAGAAVLAQSREILRHVAAMRALAAGEALAGEIRLGAISTALTGLLPALLKRFVAAAPRVEFYVVPGTSVDLYRRVQEGDLDAAILVQPPFTWPKTCAWETLRRERLVVLTSTELRRRDPHVLLREQPFIRYDRNHWGGRLADSYLRDAGIRPREVLELDALEAIAVLVSEGLGISLVPDWAPPWPAGISVRKLGLPASAQTRDIGLLWRRDSQRLRLIDALRQAAGRKSK